MSLMGKVTYNSQRWFVTFKNNSQNGSHHFTSLVTTVCSFVPICTVAHAGRCFVKIVEIRINQNNTTK